ncbi:hypothetical protein BPOR_1076g00020 [Botrytis porri]|uniref:Cytochrome P450 n=1 Tax=Botrytis porri TaxID=87229 RepID=A0A4Z1K6A0_9HELO|nr:hypothetical protein BPOR_1076g00020 [Botrytis porri]
MILETSLHVSFVRYLGTIVLLYSAHVLYRGLSIRWKFRKLQAQGMPVPKPYSILLGHIPLMKALREGLPSDAHDTYVARKLSLNWKDYFPDASSPPPLAYLDLWPFLSRPLIMVFSPQACAQLTQDTPQPRHSLIRWSLTPLTGGKYLTSVDTSTHRVWRSRLNPGFSPKNLISQMDMLLEEVTIFVQKLKAKVGENKNWGDSFTIYEDVVSLTFDIIFRSVLDYKTNEQTKGSGPLFGSMMQLIKYVKKPNLMSKLERWLPAYRNDVSHGTKTINDILVPHIQARIADKVKTDGRKTVVDLCLEHIPAESNEKKPVQASLEYIELVLSQVKVFILAGHHTTAQAICWVLYEIHKYPDVLQQLRSEHDEVLSSNPEQAAEILSKQPHKLKGLHYTHATIKETLRVHALGQTHREGSPGFNFLIDDIVYPTEGMIIQTVPAATQARPDLWPRVKEFLPERFLVAEGHDLYPPKNAWRPFELGNTRCIGEELAMMEIKLILVLTLRNLEFDFTSKELNKLQEGESTPDTVDGNRVYRVGNGLGYIKDNLITSVKLR